jgi:hypothetical protein
MSGTPSISEVYAVTGGRKLTGKMDPPVSLVVLARGPRLFREQALAEFHEQGFSEILFVEDGRQRSDARNLLDRFPDLRLLVPLRPQSPGTRINEAAREVRGDRFLVVWDDQSLAGMNRVPPVSSAVAVVPVTHDRQGRSLPSVTVPGLEHGRLKILSLDSDGESVETLFPLDYTAMYDRERFLRTGGYDAVLAPFWQKLDWGLRSRLWGESLRLLRSFQVAYRAEPPFDDQTPDVTYPRFYLRNLAVRHEGDHGVLPLNRFWNHARRAGQPLGRSIETFFDERRWVRTHRYRFQTDVRLMTELWGMV